VGDSLHVYYTRKLYLKIEILQEEFCVSEDFHQSQRQGVLPEAAGGDWRNDGGTGGLVPGRTRTSAIAQKPRNWLRRIGACAEKCKFVPA
jgi:hypothetical protein